MQTRIELADIGQAISSYVKISGVALSGSASSILSKLTGENEQKIIFLYVKPGRKNSLGEYRDVWGKPFQIIITNTDNLIVWSAGPNGVAGDSDDLALTNKLSQ